MSTPKIFVFTGTSGSGRKTIAHRIGSELGLIHVASCTTRGRRAREVSERDYHYVTTEEFEAAVKRDEFVQWVRIDHAMYGIRRTDLEEALRTGKPVYVILNKEGASALKQLYGDRVVRLFLYVDKQTVRERLEAKGTAYGVIESYMDHYMEEVLYRRECEHVCENVELERTLGFLKETIRPYLS